MAGGTPRGQLIERFWPDCRWELHFAITAGEREIWHWIDRFQLIYREICICHSAGNRLLAPLWSPPGYISPRPWAALERCQRGSLPQSFDSQTFWPVWALKWIVPAVPRPHNSLYLAVFLYEYALIELLPRQTVMRLQTNAASTSPLFPSPSLNCKSSVQLGSVMKAAETATNICVSFVVFSVCCATN